LGAGRRKLVREDHFLATFASFAIPEKEDQPPAEQHDKPDYQENYGDEYSYGDWRRRHVEQHKVIFLLR